MVDTHSLPVVEPYPGARTRWDYYQAHATTESIQAADTPSAIADILVSHVFRTHSDVLDLPPAVLHRWEQSQRIMSVLPNGQELLESGILKHMQTAEQELQNGYALAQTSTILSSKPGWPLPLNKNGGWVQRVMLPEEVQERALRWNHWAQAKIKNGDSQELFGGHPDWVGVKLAEGSWLQVGNLMVEMTEGLARIRSRHHTNSEVENQLGLTPQSDEWAAGLDTWFAMTHIMDKELLVLASSLGSSMIDGMKLTPEVYAKSYLPTRQIIDQNKHLGIAGVLSDGTWAYSKELSRCFPHQPIAGLHDIAGLVAEVGTASDLDMPAQITFATHNPERQAAFIKGAYQVGIAARFIDYEGMGAVIEQLGI